MALIHWFKLFLPLSVPSTARLTALLLRTGCLAGYLISSGAPGARGAAAGEVKTVVINHFQYQPPIVTIHQGDTVEWKNIDIVPHTATAADGKTFNSGSIASGASWRFRFTTKGIYDYLCTLHPNMKAQLIVE